MLFILSYPIFHPLLSHFTFIDFFGGITISIIGLDTATVTGVGILQNGIYSTTIFNLKVSHKNNSHGEKYRVMWDNLTKLIHSVQDPHVVFELRSYSINRTTDRFLDGLSAIVILVCELNSIPYFGVYPTQWRKLVFEGVTYPKRSKEFKLWVVPYAEKTFHLGNLTHDQAEALFITMYGGQIEW